jgi:N-acetylmuramic acid 6-phosphate etherase
VNDDDRHAAARIAALATERVDPAFADLDAWPTGRALAGIVEGQRRAIGAVAGALPALERAADGIAARLERGGRLAYAGAGTSGRLALLDAAELPPTFGFDRTVVLMAGGTGAISTAREGAEDDAAEAEAGVAAASLGPDDALIGLAASGRTPYTVAAVRAARAAGAFTVGIANVAAAPLLDAADVAVWLDTGPEVLAGSTRLAAGTSQKAALNALSTVVLVRLGGAYGNLMVGMRPTNEKLRRRAVAIVAAATGADGDAAAEALAAAADDVRTAIVMLAGRVDPERARAALTAHGLRVRAALAALAGPGAAGG